MLSAKGTVRVEGWGRRGRAHPASDMIARYECLGLLKRNSEVEGLLAEALI